MYVCNTTKLSGFVSFSYQNQGGFAINYEIYVSFWPVNFWWCEIMPRFCSFRSLIVLAIKEKNANKIADRKLIET